ncbi:MAG: hypothetical protein AAF590_03750 [Pseudomonadota bacterium]
MPSSSDPFSSHMAGLESPASDGFVIVPSDSADLSSVTRAIYVGSGGDLVATMKSGTSITFTGLLAGTVLPIRVSAVAATGTSAGNLIGLV